MKSRGHRFTLTHNHRICSLGREDLDSFADVGNLRRAYENHLDRGITGVAFEVTKKLAGANRAVNLTPVGIASDADVECSKSGLWGVLHFLCEQDRARASAERRF